MTEKTLNPTSRGIKKKSGEILRFLQFMATKRLEPEHIQEDTGVSVRTITNSIYEDSPLGAKLLRQCHLIYGLSIDWILSDSGQMFISSKENEINQDAGVYVANNDRLSRIITSVDEWMIHANEDEKAWLEVDIKQKLIRNWPPMGKHNVD